MAAELERARRALEAKAKEQSVWIVESTELHREWLRQALHDVDCLASRPPADTDQPAKEPIDIDGDAPTSAERAAQRSHATLKNEAADYTSRGADEDPANATATSRKPATRSVGNSKPSADEGNASAADIRHEENGTELEKQGDQQATTTAVATDGASRQPASDKKKQGGSKKANNKRKQVEEPASCVATRRSRRQRGEAPHMQEFSTPPDARKRQKAHINKSSRSAAPDDESNKHGREEREGRLSPTKPIEPELEKPDDSSAYGHSLERPTKVNDQTQKDRLALPAPLSPGARAESSHLNSADHAMLREAKTEQRGDHMETERQEEQPVIGLPEAYAEPKPNLALHGDADNQPANEGSTFSANGEAEHAWLSHLSLHSLDAAAAATDRQENVCHGEEAERVGVGNAMNLQPECERQDDGAGDAKRRDAAPESDDLSQLKDMEGVKDNRSPEQRHVALHPQHIDIENSRARDDKEETKQAASTQIHTMQHDQQAPVAGLIGWQQKSNISSGLTSFLPHMKDIGQQQQHLQSEQRSEPLATGKHNVQVKSLEKANAARRAELEKEEERKKRKEMLSQKQAAPSARRTGAEQQGSRNVDHVQQTQQSAAASANEGVRTLSRKQAQLSESAKRHQWPRPPTDQKRLQQAASGEYASGSERAKQFSALSQERKQAQTPAEEGTDEKERMKQRLLSADKSKRKDMDSARPAGEADEREQKKARFALQQHEHNTNPVSHGAAAHDRFVHGQSYLTAPGQQQHHYYKQRETSKENRAPRNQPAIAASALHTASRHNTTYNTGNGHPQGQQQQQQQQQSQERQSQQSLTGCGLKTIEISPVKRKESDSEEDAKPKREIPAWARNPHLSRQLAQQEKVDPDEVFAGAFSSSCDLVAMFNSTFNRKRSFARRTDSGDWSNDALTQSEESAYKRRMGFISVR